MMKGTGDEGARGDAGEAYRALMAAYFDGTATDAERELLECRLRDSPDDARAFLRMARFERDLDVVFRRDKQPMATARRQRRMRPALAVGAGACAAFAIALFVVRAGPSGSRGFRVFGERTTHTTVQTTTHPAAVPPRAVIAPPVEGTGPPALFEAARPGDTIGLMGTRIPVDGFPADPPNMVKVATLFRFDFERESDDFPTWIGTRPRPCPPGAGGGRCINGVHFETHPEQVGMSLGDWHRPVFAYSEDLFISFDYWIGQTTGRDPDIEVILYHGNDISFRMDFATHVRGRWAHVTLPLAAARRWRDPNKAPQSGDVVKAVHIAMPSRADDVFFIDNVEIARFAVARDR